MSAYNPQNDPAAFAPANNPETFGGSGSNVVPSDSTDFATYAKGIVVTIAGDVVILPVMNAEGNTIKFTACPVGMLIPYRVRRVLATGTTASVATIDQ